MTETGEEKKEAAAIRRRWITLGEVLGVAAVLISGLTLWNNIQERKSNEAERAAASSKEEHAQAALVLKATAQDGGRRLSLAPLDSAQAIQSQRIIFPSALGVSPVETVADPRIEADWIADALKKADSKEEGSGDKRVPVAIVTNFVTGGTMHSDAALYNLAYVREGHLLGSSIRLRGLSLVSRTRAKDAQVRVDKLWKR